MAMIDAGSMAQTFGAVAHGLASYRPGLPFAGVLANRVGSERHAGMLKDSLPPGMGWFGALSRNAAAALPERHLGLLQAAEIDDLESRLDQLADALAATATVDLPHGIEFANLAAPGVAPLLAGRRIAIARDAAYGFIYPANLEMLTALGAELHFFSPIAGDTLPPCDAVWLPGGYPELHAAALSANSTLWAALRAHVAAGKPLLAECGGMMSLFEQVTDKSRHDTCLRRAAARHLGHAVHAWPPSAPSSPICRKDGWLATPSIIRRAKHLSRRSSARILRMAAVVRRFTGWRA